MDFSMISAAASSITVAKELVKVVIGVRDFNEIAPVVAQLNDQLLKAQDALFSHQAQLLTLQQQHFEATEKLAKAEKALAERGRYALFALSDGVFVYRVNVPPVDSHAGDPIATEPQHYICQPCFDKGIKVVLKRIDNYRSISHYCSDCKQTYLEEKKPSGQAATNRTGPTRWITNY